MSAYLMDRLVRAGISAGVVAEAFLTAERSGSSLLEALLLRHLELAELIAECFGRDGAPADPAWRLDGALMRELPPTLPERLLAFPFRERAGAIEVVTASPLDVGLHQELVFHLKRPVRLYRGNLQGLLAAAGAQVDWSLVPTLSRAPVQGTAPIPLVRRTRARARERVRTAPGLGGRVSSGVAASQGDTPSLLGAEVPKSGSRADRILGASHLGELADALGPALPAPGHIFRLQARGLRGLWGEMRGLDLDLPTDWASRTLTLLGDGSFCGTFPHKVFPPELATLYAGHEVVRIELLGGVEGGFLVVFPDTDSSLPLRFVALARARWAEI